MGGFGWMDSLWLCQVRPQSNLPDWEQMRGKGYPAYLLIGAYQPPHGQHIFSDDRGEALDNVYQYYSAL